MSILLSLLYLKFPIHIKPSPRNRLKLITGFVFIVYSLLIPIQPTKPSWIQENPIESLLKSSLYKNKSLKALKLPSDFSQRFKEKDLQGNLILPHPSGSKPNILLIVVEGLSNFDLKDMPFLREFAKNNFHYKYFINSQRQTNRGLFSIYCGEYPNLMTSEAKTDAVIAEQGSLSFDCLPKILGKAGYETYYLQGAPLGFMRKDLFLPKFGFQKVWGKENYTKSYFESDWGVDDRTLYRYLEQTINKANKPWFVSSLTVSTHYPYVIPNKTSDRKVAVKYADDALQELLEKANSKNLLDNTLILITSDETGYFSSSSNVLLADNLGLLVAKYVRTDINEKAIGKSIDSIFSQQDFKLSILDWIQTDSKEAFGRSFFRSYQAPRKSLFFGNSFRSVAYLILEEKTQLSCFTQENRCYESLFKKNNFYMDNQEDHKTIFKEVTKENLAIARASLATFDWSVSDRADRTVFKNTKWPDHWVNDMPINNFFRVHISEEKKVLVNIFTTSKPKDMYLNITIEYGNDRIEQKLKVMDSGINKYSFELNYNGPIRITSFLSSELTTKRTFPISEIQFKLN
ncbi:MAG: LTA synthase family protein [Bdellovibrionales bacterium]